VPWILPKQVNNDTLYANGHRKTALKEAFSALMLAEPTAVSVAVQRLATRLKAQADAGDVSLSAKEALALRLNAQYPEARLACRVEGLGQ